MELLTKLGVDWQLLLAQTVNFLIVLGVLSFFVYRPFLDLLDKRRERIRKSMEDVRAIEQQKREIDQLRIDQLKKIDEECGVLLERSRHQAEKMKEEILAGAKKEVEKMLDAGKRQLQDERAKVMADVQDTLASMVVRLTEKILQREFAAADQQRLIGMLAADISTPSR